MPSPTDRSILLRRFDGVNLLVDQAYLGPTYLRAAQNFIPGETFRLQKTPGARTYGGIGMEGVAARLMVRAYSGANRYLYTVVYGFSSPSPTFDQLWVSINDAVFVRVANSAGGDADFTTTGGRFGGVVLNGVFYVGNGVDPIFSVPIGGSATALAAITAFTDGSAAPTVAADAGAQILTGTYAYAWCIFDHTASVWKERGDTREITNRAAADNSISFPPPSGFAINAGALSTRYRAHLFIAPINLPVEFGHDHTPEGVQAGATVIRAIIADGPPLPLRGVARTGHMLRGHRGRLIVAEGTAVWATTYLVPGLEQSLFNAGVFFPTNARLPRTPGNVTGIGLAATGEAADPAAVLVVCTLSETFLFYGDFFDDPSAVFRQVSSRVGCIAPTTMVETPLGLFFVGLESVYYIPVGGGPPVDVGWPISPAIKAIPAAARPDCLALYHKGFLKLAIVPAGSAYATQQWWLDLRRGVGQIPSWWGPHNRIPIGAWCTGQEDAAETDIGFHGTIYPQPSSGFPPSQVFVEKIHQTNVFTELSGVSNLSLISRIQTGDLDDGRPFDRKLFERVRVTAFPEGDTSLAVTIQTDGGMSEVLDQMPLLGSDGATWDVDDWNVADWTSAGQTEGETVANQERQRGRAAALTLTHSDPVGLGIRDFELRYQPIERPVRSVSDDPTS